MRRAFQSMFLAFGLFASMPLVAHAHSPRADQGSFFVGDRDWFASRTWLHPQRPHGEPRDPGAAGAACILLVGSVAVLAGRRRKDP